MIDYAETNFSAEQSPPREDARIQSPDGDQERPSGTEEAAGQRAQASDTGTLLKTLCLPKKARLRNSAEFRTVYEHGKRYDGPLMSVFVLRNNLDSHRLGITASRKLALEAVKRNRAKRLLREAFRLSRGELDSLNYKYDWVLNARRALLKVKSAESLHGFHEIIARVIRNEREKS